MYELANRRLAIAIMNVIYDLARATSEHLRSLNGTSEADSRVLQEFANDLAQVTTRKLPVQISVEEPVRALKYAPLVLGQKPDANLQALFTAACTSFGCMRWTEFYAEDEWSRDFLPKFAGGMGIGPDGRLHHSEIILGLFILGPKTFYPAHAHPAQEFYLILHGNPEFQIGADGRFETKEAGSVALHHTNVSHAIKTNEQPLFAVFGWRGELSARSWYRNDMNDLSEPIKYPAMAKL